MNTSIHSHQSYQGIEGFSLSKSASANPGLQSGQGIQDKQIVGSQICNTIKNVAIAAVALKNATEFASHRGMRFLTAGTTLATGLSSLYTGNIMTGLTFTAIGAKEMYNMFGTNYDESEVKRLIGDTQAGIKMIQTLEEANGKSYEIVNGNLGIVNTNLQELKSRMENIRSLAVEGSQKLEEQKTKTTKLYQEAEALFLKAQVSFADSKESINQSDNLFEKALKRFSKVIDIAQEEVSELNAEEKVNLFATEAKDAYEECLAARSVLQQSGQSLDEGMKILEQAISKYNEASMEAGKTDELAKHELEAIAREADTQKIEEETQEKIDEMQSELNLIKARHQDKALLLEAASEDLEEAQQLLDQQWGTFSIIVGGGLGALGGGAMFGGLGTVGGIAVGAKLVHERHKIGEFIFGADPEPAPQATPKNPVQFEFNAHSTGFWGRFIEKRQSYTAGKVSVDVGNGEQMSVKFNLNDKSKISKKDLEKVASRLLNNLRDNKVSAEHCLKVIDQLQNMYVERDKKHKASIGFVSQKDAVYFNELKRKCESRLQKASK
ncbi:hypothetical protein [Candidatus Protochlamydia phocaeensis]|uniref:hypothetical protein n=1 Tax=Candidatus Protochlamydia phocaeensis TaxID=1414722 RepID=UPI0008396338|nr:hypothetical protein [Candidatus Protochlamydia phocaeensis]